MRVFIKQEPNKMGGKVSFFVNKRLNRLSDDELLLHACKSNNLSQVEYYLKKGPCLDLKGKHCKKALKIIYRSTLPQQTKIQLLEHLLNQGANGFVRISHSGTYLHYMLKNLCQKLIEKEDLALINKCLASATDETDVDAKDSEGMTVFHMCCKAFAIASEEPSYALRNTLERFLSHGCDINSQNIYGDTCMHTLLTMPTYLPVVNVIHFLLGKGVDLSIVNNEGESPLYQYHRFSHILNIAKGVEAVDLELLKAGANPNQMSDKVMAPIDFLIGKIIYLMKISPPFDLVSRGYPWMYLNFVPFDRILCLFLNHLRAGLNVNNIQVSKLTKFVQWLWQKVDQINSDCEKSVGLLCQCLRKLHCHGFSSLIHKQRPVTEKTDVVLQRITKEFVTLQELSVHVIRISLLPNAFVGVQKLPVPTAVKEIIGLVDCKVITIDMEED